MELLTSIISSPIYLFLKEILPDGFDKQVVNFVFAYLLMRFTVMKHFKLIEGKFDTLTKAINSVKEAMENGFKSGDARMSKTEKRLDSIEEQLKEK